MGNEKQAGRGKHAVIAGDGEVGRPCGHPVACQIEMANDKRRQDPVLPHAGKTPLFSLGSEHSAPTARRRCGTSVYDPTRISNYGKKWGAGYRGSGGGFATARL